MAAGPHRAEDNEQQTEDILCISTITMEDLLGQKKL